MHWPMIAYRRAAMGARKEAETTPELIDVERDGGVTITWADGHVSRFGLEGLRIWCQCAQCRDLRHDGQVAWPRPGAPETLRIEGAEKVGNWGLNLEWNDGHGTGIYTWDTLRAWCPCEECQGPG
ncbi:MAG: hypothetical protein QOG43_832 [Actinomycetota bacterium]|nr:hypothetical protein [Actinomycetota bacterium]